MKLRGVDAEREKRGNELARLGESGEVARAGGNSLGVFQGSSREEAVQNAEPTAVTDIRERYELTSQ